MPYKDPEKQRAYQAAWIKARREKWLTKNGPCLDCGSWEMLEVDHVDATTKVTHRIWSWSLSRRSIELEKCVVRCRRCHDLKTATSGEFASRTSVSVVKQIRRLRSEGSTVKELANRFGLDRTNILKICKRQTWSKID